MLLSPTLLDALANLEQKSRGVAVEWINIGDARSLVDQGFAVKTRQGWSITAEGRVRLLKSSEPRVRPSASITPFRGMHLVTTGSSSPVSRDI